MPVGRCLESCCYWGEGGVQRGSLSFCCSWKGTQFWGGLKRSVKNWMWWLSPRILALRRLRQVDYEFQVSLGYIVIPLC